MKIAVVIPRWMIGDRAVAGDPYDGLMKALNKAGHDVTQILIHVDKTSFKALLEAYCEFFYLDLNQFDLVISTEAPSYMVRHKNHISYLSGLIHPFYENVSSQSVSSTKEYERQMRLIYALDMYGLNPDKIKKHFALSEELVQKLRDVNPFWKWLYFDVLLPKDNEGGRATEKGGYPAQSLSWDNVVERILDPSRGSQNLHSCGSEFKRILVTDIQPLDPPIGGGRVRISELYRHFDPSIFEITYLGTFDYLGPDGRKQKLADHFTEILVPMTVFHIMIDKIFSKLCKGTTTLDVTSTMLIGLTPRYQRDLAQLMKGRDIIIVSHPWVYPLVKKELEKLERRPILIYDSQNLEYKIKKQLLNGTLMGKYLVNKVKNIESLLLRKCDLVFACSQDDAKGFIAQYGARQEKILIVPNGASVQDISVPNFEEKRLLRFHLGFERPTAIFLASGGYKPNDEAAEYISNLLAHEAEEVDFVIVGSVCDVIKNDKSATIPANVKLMGVVSSEDKKKLLYASDLALNPVEKGSGTNIKVFDYLASGLPLITTPVGARGIDFTDHEDVIIVDLGRFPEEIQKIINDEPLKNYMSKKARELAERYDWAEIAKTAERGILAVEELLK
jgi:glycosyltransferase involved in cell wall biosynthesis